MRRVRWLTFAILAVLTLCLQTTLAPVCELFSARPQWMLALAVFYALYAPMTDAVIAAWVLGLLVDLQSVERLGVHALGFAVSALVLAPVDASYFRRRYAVHFGATFAAMLVFCLLMMMYRRLTLSEGHYDEGTGRLLWTCVFTAAWAVPMHALLLRWAGLWGIAGPRGARRPIRIGRRHV